MFRFVSARVPAFAVIAQQVRGISADKLNDTLKTSAGESTTHQKTSVKASSEHKFTEKNFSGKSDNTKVAEKIAASETKSWDMSQAPNPTPSFQKTHGGEDSENVNIVKEESAQKRMKEDAARNEPRGERRDSAKSDGSA
eukprot:GILK01028564.1.p1 GENE.GILK01028564.1~~GILK01028564.1.p1  ORF type:complete len:140 (-),score=20.41 GILK01028564.1:94-513(-)